MSALRASSDTVRPLITAHRKPVSRLESQVPPGSVVEVFASEFPDWLLCRSLCKAAKDGGGGVGEELVRSVLRVCEPFDREAVEQRDDRGCDLVAWKCELHALVARYTFDDASDEGRKPRMPFDELDGGLRISHGLVPQIDEEQIGLALFQEY